jgi:NAD(P)-dependent dehydrogenase (short-subunit alcohol dehydrogenase family)
MASNVSNQFGFESTTDEVLAGVDLSGQRALITGASAGLGVETARALAAHGADVIMAVRDMAKGERAAETVRADAPKSVTVTLVELDLASLKSVRACADALLAEGRPLNLLIANAGVMACPQGTTADGFETQFGTNHLGHFVFVNKLVPLLLAGAPARIVCLSSSGHRYSAVDLDDPNFERTAYDPWTTYGRAKTANALFALELDRRLKNRGVRAASVHPGGIRTELGRHMTPEIMQQMMDRIAGQVGTFTFKSVEQGAATTVWAATVADPDEIGGRYCEDCHVAEPTDDPVAMNGVRPHAQDPAAAAALWARSEQLVGETFPLS